MDENPITVFLKKDISGNGWVIGTISLFVSVSVLFLIVGVSKLLVFRLTPSGKKLFGKLILVYFLASLFLVYIFRKQVETFPPYLFLAMVIIYIVLGFAGIWIGNRKLFQKPSKEVLKFIAEDVARIKSKRHQKRKS